MRTAAADGAYPFRRSRFCVDLAIIRVVRCSIIPLGGRATVSRMDILHITPLTRLWTALRSAGPYIGIALLPGGLLILCMLFVVSRRDAIGVPWR
jgi:hypothetical protein